VRLIESDNSKNFDSTNTTHVNISQQPNTKEKLALKPSLIRDTLQPKTPFPHKLVSSMPIDEWRNDKLSQVAVNVQIRSRALPE
jgi:hypothetical protein